MLNAEFGAILYPPHRQRWTGFRRAFDMDLQTSREPEVKQGVTQGAAVCWSGGFQSLSIPAELLSGMFQDHISFACAASVLRGLAEETQNRKDVPTMPGGIGGMDYCLPCKAKTGPLFMICHAIREAANSGLFRCVRDSREIKHCMQIAARRTSEVQRDNFKTTSPIGDGPQASIDHAAGLGWNVPTAAGSMTRETALLLFNSVCANVSTIDRISFACTQGRIDRE